MKNHILAFLLFVLPLMAISQTVKYDFEDGDISGWTQFPTGMWTTSTSNPVEGLRSLKHAPSSGAAADRISINLPTWNGSEGSVTWRFKLRHGYDPSSGNNWAIFLTSDKDAEGMILGGNPNGYVLGVNLTGSDDLIRLYRVDNGNFTSIYATTVNWQTIIGKTGIGAIEVERKGNGTFNLRISVTGQYQDLVEQGSVADLTHSFGGYFGVYYLYTTSAAGLLTVDDISFTFNPLNVNDYDAIVTLPTTPIEGGIISSLAISSQQAVDVFRFKVTDQATSDGLPTDVTKLKFSKVDGVNAANLSETIGGVVLSGSEGEIPIQTVSVTNSSIEIYLDQGQMVIGDGDSEEFTLSVYLKPESIIDGATLQLKIDGVNHGWESFYQGTAFADEFTAVVLSNVFTIQVIPTHLSFTDYPAQLSLNQSFGVVARASDISGNLATTYNESGVTLALSSGEGNLMPTGALIGNAVNGVITWSNITYSGNDNFSLMASAPGLQTANGSEILVINDPTTVVVPTTQPQAASISSTLILPGQSKDVFRFKIMDDGQNDGQPTLIRQLYIKRPSGSNMASFSTHIAGVVIRVNNQVVSVGNPYILTASISIPIPLGGIVVPDGESVEISLSVYLKSSGLIDGSILSFMVDQTDHGFLAFPQGSSFAPSFAQQIVSNSFPIDVAGTRLKFTSTPSQVGLGDEFSVEVSAVDAGGSIDLDATPNVILSKNSGGGLLTIPNPEVTLTNGKATWTGLSYNLAEPFTLLASSPTLNDVISSLIYCSDVTSSLVQATIPLTAGVISTLVTSPEQAIEVYRFGVSDLGTTDGLPTYITRMVFKSFGLPTDYPLSMLINGVSLWKEEVEVPVSSVSITNESITLDFMAGDITVFDGETNEYDLKIYLKEGGQLDGSTICLYVPSSSHGWQAANMGTAFAPTFNVGVVGPVFTVVAEATSIAFVSQPFMVSQSQPAMLRVAAVDQFGNIDRDATGEVTLGIDYGPGGYSVSTNTATLVSGLSTWDDIVLDSEGKYRFWAESTIEGFVRVNSEPIWSGGQVFCAIDEDFEDGYPATFPESDHWQVSSVSPIDGSGSLKHALTGVAGRSTLPIVLGIENLGDSPREWSFVMRNGMWDPTADNAFWFVLASDSESISLGEYNGYAVGINLLGSTDLLTLWRIDKNSGTQVLVKSNFDWNESETIAVRVTRTPNGEWSLWYKTNAENTNYRLAGKAFDTSVSKSSTCGPVFKYTSTRAGEFWLDNLNICAVQYPPVIQSASLLSRSSVSVKFSSVVNVNDALTPSNYRVKSGNGQVYSVLASYAQEGEPSMFSLRTEELPNEELQLFAKNIASSSGGLVVNDSIRIGMGTMGNFGNIVINEIMARPSDATELPNVEYIELYNRTSSSISIAGWKVRGNTYTATIANGVIEPNGYVILSGTTGQNAMSQYGNAIGVSSFPTLLVGGMFLGIYDNSENLISWVEYSDKWYNDEIKKAGGYSLERIDSDNLVEGAVNWRATNDPSGGTPGRVNSVHASNPDVTSPRVVGVEVIDATHIAVVFSEVMDNLSITAPHGYALSNGIGNPVWLSTTGPKYNRVELTLGSAMTVGQIYDLCFTNEITDFSGNSIVESCRKIAIPQVPIAGDIAINELLFNPYTGGVDFVELYNNSDKTIDLKTMRIANRSITTMVLNEDYAASDSAWLLMPSEYAVITENPLLVSQFYYVEDPNAMVWLKKLPAYSNDNGYVVFLNNNGEVIDEFAYDKKMHNNLLSDVKGISLERLNPTLPSNQSSSWQSAAQTAGYATPTAKNSQFTDAITGDDSFSLSHQIFSPDGDGFEDVLLINYELPESGYLASIMVFDSKGRRVKRIGSNMLLGTSGSIQWDGADDAGRRASMGAYVIFIEAFDLKGNVKRYKKTVVVATKLR